MRSSSPSPSEHTAARGRAAPPAGPPRARALVVALVALVVALAGCGGGDDDGATAADDSTTTTTDAASSTTTEAPVTESTEPLSYPEALTARLAEEWDDPDLAATVVGGIDDTQLTAFSDAIPAADVATSDALTYRVPTTPADEVDSLVAYAFGYRQAADGTIEPGGPNEDIAAAIAAFVAEHPVPVFAQTEIAGLLTAQGVADVVSIDPVVAADGTVTYLSTQGVIEQVVTRADQAGVDLGTVGVVGFADHLGRCWLTTRAAGVDAVVPEGITPPSEYDPESAQPWTVSREAYLPVDLATRPTFAGQ